MDSRFYIRLLALVAVCILVLNPLDVWACPGCVGSLGKKNDQFTVWGLCIFILATYIPMSMLYRMVYKHRKINAIIANQDSNEK